MHNTPVNNSSSKDYKEKMKMCVCACVVEHGRSSLRPELKLLSIIIDRESEGLVGDEDEDTHRASLEALSTSTAADPLRIPTPSTRFKTKPGSVPLAVIEILFWW